MSLAEDATPCTVCGEPVLWGTRHPVCGQRVMAAEALDLDQLKRIVSAKEAAAGVAAVEAPSEPDAYKLCDLWFAEWELILPADARQSFIDDLLQSVRAVTRGVSGPPHQTFPHQPPMPGKDEQG